MNSHIFRKFLLLAALTISVSAKPMFNSGTITGNSPAKKISVDITGWKDLYLVATDGGNGNGSDHAVWGNPTLTDSNGKQISLLTLKCSVIKVGWSSVIDNQTPQKKPLSIHGKAFKLGLFAHAVSIIHYKIEGKYTKFEAEVGIQDGNKGGSCNFIVKNKNLPKPDVVPSVEKLELAIKDLTRRFRKNYPNGPKYLTELKELAKLENSIEKENALVAFQQKALLENPLLKQFKDILVIRRKYGKKAARRVVYTRQPSMNTYSLEAINPHDGVDDIVKISNFFGGKEPIVKSIYKPALGGAISGSSKKSVG